MVKNSRIFSPKLHREYYYVKSNARYMKRVLFGRDDWKNIFAGPPVLAGFNAASIFYSMDTWTYS